MKNTIWEVTWILTNNKTGESHQVTSPQESKLKAIDRYLWCLFNAKEKKFSMSSVAIWKNGYDVTSKINKWLSSDRVC